MKKVVFAIQVFSLMAMFPAYVVAEFNHGTGRLTLDHSASVIIKESVKIGTRFSLNSSKQNNGVVLFKSK